MSEHIIVTEVCYGVPFVPIGGTGELREEIVRCKDCAKWSFFDVEDGKRIGDCSEWTHLDGFGHATNENGFCAWGERE